MKTAEEWIKECPMAECIHKETGGDILIDVLTIPLIKQIQLDAFKAGMTEACAVVQCRADNYDDEHGHTDLETGTREYPKNGDNYMLELTEIIESITSARDRKESL